MSRVSSPVFVGRRTELERLHVALEHARRRRPMVRLVFGEAGIGKTRLVGEFVAQARASGARALVGGCLQLGDTGLPYAPFVAALRPLVRSLSSEELDALVGPGRAELARLMPDLGPSEPTTASPAELTLSATAAPARLFEIVFGVLRRLSDERPLVLVLEDIHWADASSLDLLRFLARGIRDARLVLVATYRSDELHRRHPIGPLLAELRRLPNVDGIEVDAFGRDELAAQLSGITGEPPEARLVETILARSGGNPFFAEELLAAGQEQLALPGSLRDTLIDRLRHMNADGQRLLRVASVAGERVHHRLLEEVSGLSEPILLEAIRMAVDHHLLVPAAPHSAPAYAFRHALMREAAYEELLPLERTQLHAAYAQAIEASPDLQLDDPGSSAALLAHHWYMAHDLERALPAAIVAGREAAAGFAFAEAQHFLERALELWPKVRPDALPSGIDRRTILEEAAEASAQAGDAQRSIGLARVALAETDPITEPMRAGIIQHRLSWYLNESGDWQGGVAALERAAELIPIEPPTPMRARVVADLAHSLMVRGRYGDSMALAEAALAISRSVGAPVAETRALNALGLDLAGRSDLERGIPLLREGSALARDLGDPLAIFLTSVGLGWALDEAARHAESLEVALSARAHLVELGAGARFGGQLASKASRALYELGRWDEAAELLDETIAAGSTRYALRWLLSNRIRLRTSRGDFAGARADLAAYDSLGERVIGPDPDLVAARRAELAIAADDPRIARDLVRDTLDAMVEPDLDTEARALVMIGLRAEEAELLAARAARDHERQVAALERFEALDAALWRHVTRVREAVHRPTPVLNADASVAAAMAAEMHGRSPGDAWSEAVAAWRAVGRPFDLATVLHRAAAAHLVARRRRDGAALLAESHATAVAIGAVPLRTTIEALARRVGIGLDGLDASEDPADRLGLTPREREVLVLLMVGRTNREIGDELRMAESTAGVHVSNILSKLGVARRGEAALVAHRIGLGAG